MQDWQSIIWIPFKGKRKQLKYQLIIRKEETDTHTLERLSLSYLLKKEIIEDENVYAAPLKCKMSNFKDYSFNIRP